MYTWLILSKSNLVCQYNTEVLFYYVVGYENWLLGVLILNCGAKGVQCVIMQCYIVILLHNKLGQHLPLFIFSLCYCKEGSCWTNHFKKCDIKKNLGIIGSYFSNNSSMQLTVCSLNSYL